jgi:dihydrofolate reductase
MSKLVVTEFVSVDGVMQDPGGDSDFKHAGWTFDIDTDEAVYQFKGWELEQADTQLLGRKTYEGFAAAWPERGGDGGFADKMNAMPKYVVSTTLRDPKWNNTTVIDSDVVDAVTRLKESGGGDILVAGSATLVRFLHENGLVDEYRVMVTLPGRRRRQGEAGPGGEQGVQQRHRPEHLHPGRPVARSVRRRSAVTAGCPAWTRPATS